MTLVQDSDRLGHVVAWHVYSSVPPGCRVSLSHLTLRLRERLSRATPLPLGYAARLLIRIEIGRLVRNGGLLASQSPVTGAIFLSRPDSSCLGYGTAL